MTDNYHTHPPIKVILHQTRLRLASLIHTLILTQTRHRIGFESVTKPVTLADVCGEGLFRRGRVEFVFWKENKATVSLLPETENPKRIDLYKADGRRGLRLFYYTDNPERLYVANGSAFIHVGRDDIPAVRSAIRKFTRTRRFSSLGKPGRPFSDYGPPAEKAAA